MVRGADRAGSWPCRERTARGGGRRVERAARRKRSRERALRLDSCAEVALCSGNAEPCSRLEAAGLFVVARRRLQRSRERGARRSAAAGAGAARFQRSDRGARRARQEAPGRRRREKFRQTQAPRRGSERAQARGRRSGGGFGRCASGRRPGRRWRHQRWRQRDGRWRQRAGTDFRHPDVGAHHRRPVRGLLVALSNRDARLPVAARRRWCSRLRQPRSVPQSLRSLPSLLQIIPACSPREQRASSPTALRPLPS